MMVPVLALAGSMVDKRIAAPGPGTFPTGDPLFAALLVAVIVVVGALTFFPTLCLGPVIEHFAGQQGGSTDMSPRARGDTRSSRRDLAKRSRG